jgi:hypothetical protein
MQSYILAELKWSSAIQRHDTHQTIIDFILDVDPWM